MSVYITTPIYYVNAEPHIGHAYTTIVADTYSRFQRLRGQRVRFQTGTDEHGDKIAEAAAREDIAPRAYADKISGKFRAAWPLLACKPDNFIRTTDPAHIALVRRILQTVYDKGDIYFDSYTGLYCRGCERFLTEKELVDGLCPDHRAAPREIAEQNYFFRMSKYQDKLVSHIKKHADFITPERYRNEVLSFLSEPLEDLCISRPKSRLTWGIELPFDENFVTYVWFDALINYLTGLGYPDDKNFHEFWPTAEHLIAKDILKPHAIYWSTMLMSLGVPLYKKLHVHGYWNNEDAKMSKSLGNVIGPQELVESYGLDPFRYFALREMSFGLDASFSREAIIARRNSDLANDLGNLFSRSLSMAEKYVGLIVPAPVADESEIDHELREAAVAMLAAYNENMADFRFHRALQAVWELVSHANKYIVTVEPWALAKDEKQKLRLDTVLYNLCEVLRLLTLVLRPVMPDTSAKMAVALGYAPDDEAVASLPVGGRWGVLAVDQRLRGCPALFPRLEVAKAQEKQSEGSIQVKAVKHGDESQAGETGQDIADFRKFDIRVVEIVAASRVKKSDKLLRLTVLAPDERIIVSGIGQYYAPEELIGRQVLAVCNLKPAKLMGITSQGMILTARDDADGREWLALSTVMAPVAAGASIS